MGSASAWVISCEPVVTEDGIEFDLVVGTAGHFVCEENPGPYLIEISDECLYSVGQSVHPTEDFAIVRFRSSVYSAPRKIDARDLVYGERLYLDGFPAGEGPYRRDGFSGGDNRTSTPAWPGDSGGPISDADGDVVGILVSVVSSRNGFVSFAAHMVRLADVYEWLGKELPCLKVPSTSASATR